MKGELTAKTVLAYGHQTPRSSRTAFVATGARKAPNSNIQAPEKLQAPSINRCCAIAGGGRTDQRSIPVVSGDFRSIPVNSALFLKKLFFNRRDAEDAKLQSIRERGRERGGFAI